MSARIFIHPHCLADESAGAELYATLAENGYDTAKVLIGPTDYRNRVELVRFISANVDSSKTYERMDGKQFIHGPNRVI